MEEKKYTSEQETARKIKRRTFISFTVFGLASVAGIGAWKWFRSQPKSAQGLSSLSRKTLLFNEKINSKFFSHTHLATSYPKSKALKKPRINGWIGMNRKSVPEAWTLKVENPISKKIIPFTIEDLKKFPKTEVVYNFKCIEGWDQIIYCGGVKFSDFLLHQNIGTRTGKIENPEDWFSYVGLETPDKKYYVGLDMKSVLHPQTILCYELNGKNLPLQHGAPLRLIIPVKYGIKNLKCIGSMTFSDIRPRDYWHERGYDYDAAL